MEGEDDDVGWDSFMRVKVLLDLCKPPARGRTITLHGLKHWIPLEYEKLPRFCFMCGRILHEIEVCPEAIQLKNEPTQFGSWFWVALDGRRKRIQQMGVLSRWRSITNRCLGVTVQ